MAELTAAVVEVGEHGPSLLLEPCARRAAVSAWRVRGGGGPSEPGAVAGGRQ